jgi:hypothetical protein
MNKKMKKNVFEKYSKTKRLITGIFLCSFFSFSFFFIFSLGLAVINPTLVHADIVGIPQPQLIVCGGDQASSPGKPGNDHPCGFPDLFLLATNLIAFIFFLAIPITTIGVLYAGWLYLTAGATGNEGNIKTAKSIAKNLALGFLWVLGAWLVVYTIADPFLNKDPQNGFKIFQL